MNFLYWLKSSFFLDGNIWNDLDTQMRFLDLKAIFGILGSLPKIIFS